VSLARRLPVYRMTHGLAESLASHHRRWEISGYTQNIERAAVSRHGLKCVWVLVRERNGNRLVAIWMNVAI
jgi:hypothetical protein